MPLRVVKLEGHLDPTTSPELSDSLKEHRETAPYYWAFDMSGLEYISSAGIAVLLALEDRAQERGGALCLFGIEGDVLKVFRMLGLDDKLEIYSGLTEARQMFSTPVH